jgi:hypothetical protein
MSSGNYATFSRPSFSDILYFWDIIMILRLVSCTNIRIQILEPVELPKGILQEQERRLVVLWKVKYCNNDDSSLLFLGCHHHSHDSSCSTYEARREGITLKEQERMSRNLTQTYWLCGFALFLDYLSSLMALLLLRIEDSLTKGEVSGPRGIPKEQSRHPILLFILFVSHSPSFLHV